MEPRRCGGPLGEPSEDILAAQRGFERYISTVALDWRNASDQRRVEMKKKKNSGRVNCRELALWLRMCHEDSFYDKLVLSQDDV